MEDREILELFWQRSQSAIAACTEKYGRYCRQIAYQILHSEEDAAEVENDAYLAAWETIPPQRPLPLLPYLGMLTRQRAINRRRATDAQKRGGGQYTLTLEELEACIPGGDGRELPDQLALKEALDRFLASLPKNERIIFMRRYWWVDAVADIAAAYSLSEAAVKMRLMRTRNKLKDFLEKEGFAI